MTCEDLIPSYEQSLQSVKELHLRVKQHPQNKQELAHCYSMASDLRFVLNWLRTSIDPYMGGVQRQSKQHYETCTIERLIDERVAQTARAYMWSDNLDAKCKWGKAMLCLSDRERLAVVLCYGEGMTAVMAAKIMQVEDSTVRRFLLRARNKFKKVC